MACLAANVATIHLVQRLRAASSNLPGRHPRAELEPKPLSSLFGLAPGGVYRAVRVATFAVRSYRTLSPLPLWRQPWSKKSCDVFGGGRCGGLLSVALSLRSPSPDVIRHHFSVEPGLSSL